MFHNIQTQQTRKSLPRPLYNDGQLIFDPTQQQYSAAGWYPYVPAVPPEGEYITDSTVAVVDGHAVQTIVSTAPLAALQTDPHALGSDDLLRWIMPHRRVKRISGNTITHSTGPVLDLQAIGSTLQSFSALTGSDSWTDADKLAVILGAETLECLENAGTGAAFACIGHNLSAGALDQFFTDLPPTLNTVVLNFRNNPGSLDCDPTLATAKGYTVTLE